MKTTEIMTIGLVTLALMVGCDKGKESTTSSTTTKSVTTPASPDEATKTQESTTTTDTKSK